MRLAARMNEDEALSDDELDDLEALLTELELCLAEEDLDGAREALAEAEELVGPDDPEVRYGRGLIAQQTGDNQSAAAEFRLALESDPDFADAHYALGLLLEELEDFDGAVHHFLRTRALDAKAEGEPGAPASKDVDRIESVARETLDSLPEEFGSLLRSVPVILEPRPSRALVESGFDPRAFGMFEGPEHGEDDIPAPTRIVLFTSNLLANFVDEELDEQVETTILHEVGHYFGLDEQDMVRLGLD